MKIKPIMLAITMISLFAITIVSIGNSNNNTMKVYAQGGPSACPDPGQCTCNAASGVMMTDHAMSPPFNRINNGCTESGTF